MSWFCCYLPPSDEPKPSRLRRLHPPSIVSVASVSPPRMQHGKANDVFTTDAEALRDIFSSSSSVRGYQAAGTAGPTRADRSKSFDENFRLPHSTPEKKPEKKPSGRLEQLGHHIKQRLSESRLSNGSSKMNIKNPEITGKPVVPASGKKVDEQAALLGTSHQTTGLSALLSSRAASEGGYDSDARSVQLPSVKSKTGTLRIGSSYVKQVLEKIDWRAEVIHTSFSNPEAENSPTRPSNERRRSQSSPIPSAPPLTTFAEALQMKSNESPVEVLRRVSMGIADGSIKMPNTPELKAMKMPSLNEAQQDWRLSVSAPRRASSLQKTDEETNKIIKTPSKKIGNVQKEKKETDKKHESLVSNIDLALLNYISNFDEHDSDSPSRPKEEKTCEIVSMTEAEEKIEDLISGAQPKVPSERNSIHLQNMRISQRLASSSHMHVLSKSNSYIGSADYQRYGLDNATGIGSLSSMIRFPSWIAQEHNRRPSDPDTKRLFENTHGEDGLHSNWKAFSSRPSIGSRSQSTAKQEYPTGDDASSFYFSDGDLPGSDAASPYNTTRRNSIKNPNSIAMPGRIPSSDFSKDYGSMSSLSHAAENTWVGKDPVVQSQNNLLANPMAHLRNRSASMPKESKFNEVISTPTPRGKRAYSSTEANELMSEIDLQRLEAQCNLALNNLVSTADSRNENLSEVDPRILTKLQDESLRHSQRRLSAGWLSQGRRSGWGFEVVKERSRSRSPTCEKKHEIDTPQESDSDVWEKALNRAREEGTVSGESNILSLPKFDRAGKRLSRSSASEYDQLRDRSPSARSKKSRSENGVGSFSIDQHQRLCSESRGPLSVTKSETNLHMDKTRECQTMKERPKKKKKSLLDMRRFTYVGMPNSQEGFGTSTSRFSRDYLSWARFPSHTREERCGTAGMKDGVDGKDFQRSNDELEMNDDLENSNSAVIGQLGLRSPTSWKLAALKGRAAKRRSMLFNNNKNNSMSKSPGLRKGLFRKWRRLYHSHSADLRRYAAGYRSSISAGRELEHPELGSLPGEGMFRFPTHEDGSGAEEDEVTPAKARKRSASWSAIPATSIWDSVNSVTSSELNRSRIHDEPMVRLLKLGIETGSESEECYPAKEARRWSSKRSDACLQGLRSGSMGVEAKEKVQRAAEGLMTAPARIKSSTRPRIVELGVSGEEGEEMEELGLPPKIRECGIGMTFGKKGSCEDITSTLGGVDGSVA